MTGGRESLRIPGTHGARPDHEQKMYIQVLVSTRLPNKRYQHVPAAQHYQVAPASSR